MLHGAGPFGLWVFCFNSLLPSIVTIGLDIAKYVEYLVSQLLVRRAGAEYKLPYLLFACWCPLMQRRSPSHPSRGFMIAVIALLHSCACLKHRVQIRLGADATTDPRQLDSWAYW